MKNILTILILCGLLFCQFAAQSQSAGNYLYSNSFYASREQANIPVATPSGGQITLKAEVMMNVRATSYTAIFAISQNGRDALETDSLMTGRLAQIRYALGMLGISEQDIHVDAVSMVPTYAFKVEEKKFNKRSIEIPTGFEMKKNIHVLFKNHDVLDRIISEMAFADVYDLVKVEYNIDGMQSYYEEMRAEALKVIESKKGTYAALNMHLDVFNLADGFQCVYPMERYKSYTAYNSGSSPMAVSYAMGARSNNVYVNGRGNTVKIDEDLTADSRNQQFVVQTAEKNKTIFYDRMPYNQFDKVINADVEEPCIQLFYSIQVYCTSMTEELWQQNQDNKAEMKRQAELAKSKGRRRKK